MSKNLYESDEYAWIEQQVNLLLDGRMADIDRDTLADHLTEMNISTQHKIGSKLATLLEHMLKIEHQPKKHTRSWNVTIVREQREIKRLLQRNRGLAQYLPKIYTEAYEDAVHYAAIATGLDIIDFPKVNPWTLEQALDYQISEPVSCPYHRCDDASVCYLCGDCFGLVGGKEDDFTKLI